MTEHWSIIDFQDLMKSILHGNRCVQEPISISNKRRDTISKISFLNLLLSYQNVNKDNLLDVLSNIYGRFHTRINGLKENEIVQFKSEIIKNKKKLKKLEPEYKVQSTLFHSKAEVEGLYQSLSRYAGVNGLIISKIENKNV